MLFAFRARVAVGRDDLDLVLPSARPLVVIVVGGAGGGRGVVVEAAGDAVAIGVRWSSAGLEVGGWVGGGWHFGVVVGDWWCGFILFL